MNKSNLTIKVKGDAKKHNFYRGLIILMYVQAMILFLRLLSPTYAIFFNLLEQKCLALSQQCLVWESVLKCTAKWKWRRQWCLVPELICTVLRILVYTSIYCDVLLMCKRIAYEVYNEQVFLFPHLYLYSFSPAQSWRLFTHTPLRHPTLQNISKDLMWRTLPWIALG